MNMCGINRFNWISSRFIQIRFIVLFRNFNSIFEALFFIFLFIFTRCCCFNHFFWRFFIFSSFLWFFVLSLKVFSFYENPFKFSSFSSLFQQLCYSTHFPTICRFSLILSAFFLSQQQRVIRPTNSNHRHVFRPLGTKNTHNLNLF